MSRKLLFKLALLSVILAGSVVVLGAFTRLVDAGLGCPDWPGCYGHLTWPNSDDEVARAEARFPETPVEHDKTWPEMVHRYFAASLGLFVIALLVIALRAKRNESQPLPIKHIWGLLGLVILQGAFGAWTVTLKLWPQVVTGHLIGGFATLSLLWLLTQRLSDWRWRVSIAAQQSLLALRPLLWVVLGLVILQILLGGWTSTNYAALACADLPKCHGEWWPKADFVQGFNIFQHVGPNYLGGLLDNHARTAIHLTHRIGAVIVFIATVFLVIKLFCVPNAFAKRWSMILLAVLFIQISLGISNVYFALPLWVAVSHNAVGALLLLVMVTLIYRVRTLRLQQQA